MNNLMLEVSELSVYYGAIHALHGVSIDIREGEIVSVVGANGAGKSTLIWAISRVVPIAGGHVEFNGKPLPPTPDLAVREGIALVPERRRLFTSLSVRENLIMGAWLRSDSADAISRDMERCFTLFPILRERITQRAGTLSGGEQQMLAFSRALMSKPRMLLLDEPSLGLAPLIVERLFETIRRVRDEDGVTMLLVEQNATQALDISDRGYVLQAGEVACTGDGRSLASDTSIQKAYLGV